MTKEDAGSGGLLAKVAKFVRNPTVDWSDLDQRTQGMDAEREALKAAIQRKRRNDKVRHNELDQLRQVMLTSRQTGDRSTSSHSSAEPLPAGTAFQPVSVVAADTTKSRTIEQIARIEQQMSQNWLRRRQEGDQEGLRIGGTTAMPELAEGGLTRPAHLGADPLGMDSSRIPIDVVGSDPNAMAGAEAALAHPAIAEAAVRFANGEFDAAEQGLRRLMVQEPAAMTARVAGLALLDLLHARRSFEGFEEFAAEFAERFGVPVPRWPVDAAADAPQAAPPAATPVAGVGISTWTCPLFLDSTAVQDLGRVMSSPGDAKWLDWTGLLSADLSAAQALKDEVDRWIDRPLTLHFLGSAVLRRRLKASTPSGRRENEPVWWLLRLGLLRAMGRQDEFDLVALDYCVTYGVMPPPWQPAVCRFEAVESMPLAAQPPAPAPDAEAVIQPLSTQMAGLDVLEWPAMVTTIQGGETLFPSAYTQMPSDWPTTLPAVSGASVRLGGYLTADMSDGIKGLTQALEMHSPDKLFVIDCQLLERVDFTAAGTLLQWLMATMGRGVQVELRGVSRLVAAFFHVVGIDEAVTVRLRQY